MLKVPDDSLDVFIRSLERQNAIVMWMSVFLVSLKYPVNETNQSFLFLFPLWKEKTEETSPLFTNIRDPNQMPL